jgi:hypothetical protein
MLKMLAFFGSIGMGSYEMILMRKQWTYYDRFYPEPTELQKTLFRDAMMFKESMYSETSVQDKLLKLESPEVRQMYSQMYQLPPQRYSDPDEQNINAPDHSQH